MVTPADSLCIGQFFPVCYGFFPGHLCISPVCSVNVLCAVSYTVAEYEWIFSSLLWIFSCVPLCLSMQ